MYIKLVRLMAYGTQLAPMPVPCLSLDNLNIMYKN